MHIGCGDDPVAAQVEVDYFIPSVGDEICRHALIQEECYSTNIFSVAIEIVYACWGGDESCGTKKTDISKHNVK